jgi:TonB family protein
MKHCPTCGTEYDEEIIRFCTKDGTPLVDDEQPNFVSMPSESHETPDDDGDDASEMTVIRRNSAPLPPPVPDDAESFERQPSERFVIPAGQDPSERARVSPPPYKAPPPRNNTFKVVVLTILGTIAVLGGAGLVFWFLQSETPANGNVNANAANVDINANTNMNIDANFDFNANSNANANANANANLRTPTPTPRPSPSPSPTPSPTPEDDDTPAPNTNSSPVNRPRPTPTPPPINAPVNVGSLNGRALSLPAPAYPSQARSVRASGQVVVQVSLDESGRVTSANAVSGHPLLRQPAENAARRSRFRPVEVQGRLVRANGIITYNFVND